MWEGVRDAKSQPKELWETGEPCALKGASTVREGEVGKGLAEIPLDVISDNLAGQSKGTRESHLQYITVPRWPPTSPYYPWQLNNEVDTQA
jgi:hypothetical protein